MPRLKKKPQRAFSDAPGSAPVIALEVCARAKQGAKHNDATIAMITGRMDTCLDEVGASSRRIRRQSSANCPVNGRAAVFHGTVSNGYVLDARREAVKA